MTSEDKLCVVIFHDQKKYFLTVPSILFIKTRKESECGEKHYCEMAVESKIHKSPETFESRE